MNSKNRKDHRTIIHFDYDCFYASVFEHEIPALKSLPLAVQQKQIIVTCNYEARRRGLRKLQLITEAKKLVPDIVIVLGEKLGRFRDASKTLYKFLASFTWSGKVERLGFDEVFMDVSDIVDYNVALLNSNDLGHSFFQLERRDPSVGFAFNALRVAGHTFPDTASGMAEVGDSLYMRLILGSHLAQHLRWKLEEEKGYTATLGISTNKLLSKLVGNLNKPKKQTTLLPPYSDLAITTSETRNISDERRESNVKTFLDAHDIGKIPGIGFKTSQLIRNHILSRPAQFDNGLIYGATKESVTVQDVQTFSNMGPDVLETILGGPGSEKGIGGRIWGLLNGHDDTEVKEARKIPSQISIEDSYLRLDSMPLVLKELRMLATSLIKRMHTDLLEESPQNNEKENGASKKWIAYPKTIRLSTRPRASLKEDGTRTRSFNRISTSSRLPRYIFFLKESSVDNTVGKLIQETLIPMFRRLHPQSSNGNWNLSLINICVTNMVEAASEDAGGEGRDISRMFRRQEDVLREWKVEDRGVPPDEPVLVGEMRQVDGRREVEPSAGDEAADVVLMTGSEDVITSSQNNELEEEGVWEDDEDEGGEVDSWDRCGVCGSLMPAFAMAAHERFHSVELIE